MHKRIRQRSNQDEQGCADEAVVEQWRGVRIQYEQLGLDEQGCADEAVVEQWRGVRIQYEQLGLVANRCATCSLSFGIRTIHPPLRAYRLALPDNWNTPNDVCKQCFVESTFILGDSEYKRSE
ncbi:hypothetical protein DICVIV_02783 [Dictyocaulus viviparus]|uniref:Uncharacterized protein n=1 Tax=Dictyocaulus viviparus TaxID=29172 RepID=A0A0D8Y4A1_DICVI|nr:hypothetical protein DICVIV_02783 [Dictyocaulus viviparus]